MTNRLLLVALGATLACVALPLRNAVAPARAAAEPPVTWLDVGDRVQVRGTPVGCIARMQSRERVVDCRIGGERAGTYGTITSQRRVLVVRFLDEKTAKIVLVARHHGAARRCG